MTTRTRRTAGTLLALVAVAATAVFASVAGALPPGTAPTGALTLTPATGDSGTDFLLAFIGADQFCAGDGAAGYRWGTFITPISNDPATVTFGGAGSATGPAFTASLRAADSTILRALQPGAGNGFIDLSLPIDFASGQFGVPMPPGDYWIGVACTFGTPDSIEYWATSITTTAATGAGPNNFTYGPSAAAATTTTTATTTTIAATSTTVTGGATSTTAVGGTTSTTALGGSTTSTLLSGASTSTTTSASSTSTTLFRASGSGTFTTQPTQTIANAGSNTGPMLLVAVLLLIGGRMVILAARRTKVLPPGER